MGQGIMSKAGYANLDDSSSMLFNGDFVAGRKPRDCVDRYLFCYSHDYNHKGLLLRMTAVNDPYW